MKILIFTQKVNKDDAILGFFHAWIEAFAKKCESVLVVCLEEGKHALPANVRVLSLGKESHTPKTVQLARFYKYIWREREGYDVVFVHMNPEYIVLAGLIWKILKKRVAFWYVHRQVNLKLKLATLLADTIFTSTRESFRIKSPKIHYVGHGIETTKFASVATATYEPLVIVHLGRVTRIKRIEVMIKALKLLVDEGVTARLEIVGETIYNEDKSYKEKLVAKAKELGIDNKIIWKGSEDARQALGRASITVNAAPSGGMDKAVLESLAAGRATFASNTAFAQVYGSEAEIFMYKSDDAEDLAKKIETFLKNPEKDHLVETLGQKVRSEFSVEVVVDKILAPLK